MKKIKNVLILGLGALGTLYADAFKKTEGVDVRVLVDEERKKRYLAEPRMLNGAPCDFEYITEPGEFDADLILINVKSGSMMQAIDMIDGHVGEETIIATFMNGVSCEELLAERYGARHVIYSIYMGDGSTNINGEINETGNSRLFFGAVGNPRDEEQVALFADLCDRAGIAYQIEDDMLYVYWRKFFIITAFNCACAVFGTNYSVYHNTDRAMQFSKKLLREALPLAKAAGIENIEEMERDILERIPNFSPELLPSITQDRIEGRRMEVDILNDEVIRRAELLGLDVPCHSFVSDVLNTINQQNGHK